MRRIILGMTALLLTVCAYAQSPAVPPSFSASAKALAAAPVSRFPALDLVRLAAEDAQVTDKSAPVRYAVPFAAPDLRAGRAGDVGGVWTTLDDGRLLWRFEVQAEAARSIDLHFQPFRMPHGAQLWLYTPDRMSVAGPYDEQHNNPELMLATPVLPGERVIVEVVVPAAQKRHLNLALSKVWSGYRGFDFVDGHPVAKSGDCNVDVICPQGNNFRSEIQSVVRYTVSGGACSGTLMNNTRQDGDPLMLSARHCFSSQTAAAGIVVYYNYNSPSCRVVGSAANGTPLNLNISSHTQTGTTLLATSTAADFSLVRLNQAPPTGANIYFAGWDRRNQTATSATGIHHPQGHEKRISMENNPLVLNTTTITFDGFNLQPGQALTVTDWDSGTTEVGSSGSALFSPEKRVIGTLSGGGAACGNDEPDYYGRMFVSFTGGGTSTSRLVDHLDPANTGAQTLDGRAPGTGGGGAPTVSLAMTPAQPLAGSDVRFTASVTGTAPFTVAWDIDGDGVNDRTFINVAVGSSALTLTTRYPREMQTTARVQITDASGQMANATRAVDVDSHVVSGSFVDAIQVCGNNDSNFDPGERWRVRTRLTNFGALSPADGVAIFTRSRVNGPGLASDLQLVTPAVSVPNGLTSNTTVETEFHIRAGSPCGTNFRLTYVGTTDARGTSGAGVDGGINIPAVCTQVSTCSAPPAGINFRQGAFFNPVRGGNGLVSFQVPQTNAEPLFFALWFTGEANRQPTWNFIQDARNGNQVTGNLVQRKRNFAASGFGTTDTVIGTGQITFLGSERMVFTYQLLGQVPSGELMTHLLSGFSAPNPNRTAAYFWPAEAGWGQTYDSFIDAAGVSTEFGLTYVYDTAGFPRWGLTQNAASLSTFTTQGFQTHCPNCGWLDIGITAQNLGTLTRQFTSRTTGVLSTNFSVPGGGTWLRNNVPIEMLTTPQPPP